MKLGLLQCESERDEVVAAVGTDERIAVNCRPFPKNRLA
jgi:hypothetical protein